MGGRWEGQPPIRGHPEPLDVKREPRIWEWRPADTWPWKSNSRAAGQQAPMFKLLVCGLCDLALGKDCCTELSGEMEAPTSGTTCWGQAGGGRAEQGSFPPWLLSFLRAKCNICGLFPSPSHVCLRRTPSSSQNCRQRALHLTPQVKGNGWEALCYLPCPHLRFWLLQPEVTAASACD